MRIKPPFDTRAFVQWLTRQKDLCDFALTGSAMWRTPSDAGLEWPPQEGQGGPVAPVCGETIDALIILGMLSREGEKRGTLVAVGVGNPQVKWHGDAAATVVYRAIHFVQRPPDESSRLTMGDRPYVLGHKNMASAPALTVHVIMVGGGQGDVDAEPGDPAFGPLANLLWDSMKGVWLPARDEVLEEASTPQPHAQRRNSGHYIMPESERRKIVEEYLRAKELGRVSSQAAFAGQKGIGERTLRNWLDEFYPNR